MGRYLQAESDFYSQVICLLCLWEPRSTFLASPAGMPPAGANIFSTAPLRFPTAGETRRRTARQCDTGAFRAAGGKRGARTPVTPDLGVGGWAGDDAWRRDLSLRTASRRRDLRGMFWRLRALRLPLWRASGSGIRRANRALPYAFTGVAVLLSEQTFSSGDAGALRCLRLTLLQYLRCCRR